MKNIFYLLNIVLCFSFNSYYSQNVAQYRSDPDLDKFVGTWKWGNTTNGLILIMKKENNIKISKNVNDNNKFDIIVGFHKLYKNGQVIDDSTMNSSTNFADKKNSFTALTQDDILQLSMSHRNKAIRIKIDYIDSSHIKIVEVKNPEGARFKLPGENSTDWSIDIPQDIILTKQ